MFKRSPTVNLSRPKECLVDWAVLVVKIKFGVAICKGRSRFKLRRNQQGEEEVNDRFN
jgi:hypothetical protein